MREKISKQIFFQLNPKKVIEIEGWKKGFIALPLSREESFAVQRSFFITKNAFKFIWDIFLIFFCCRLKVSRNKQKHLIPFSAKTSSCRLRNVQKCIKILLRSFRLSRHLKSSSSSVFSFCRGMKKDVNSRELWWIRI